MPSVDEGAYVVHFQMEQVEQARERLGRRVQNEARRTTFAKCVGYGSNMLCLRDPKANELVFSASGVLE